MVLPKGFPRKQKTILLGHNDFTNGLPWELLFVPFSSGIFDRLFLNIFQKLDLEKKLGVMRRMETLQVIGKNVILLILRLKLLFIQPLLCLARGNKRVFNDILPRIDTPFENTI